MTKQVNVAIIGLGFGAEFIPIYQKHPNANMYAICQRSEKKLHEVGDAFGVAKRYTKFEDVLKKKYPQAKTADKGFVKILTEDERKQYTELRDRSRMLTESAPRYRPMAYAVSEVTPPQVPEIASTYVLAGGDLAGLQKWLSDNGYAIRPEVSAARAACA